MARKTALNVKRLVKLLVEVTPQWREEMLTAIEAELKQLSYDMTTENLTKMREQEEIKQQVLALELGSRVEQGNLECLSTVEFGKDLVKELQRAVVMRDGVVIEIL